MYLYFFAGATCTGYPSGDMRSSRLALEVLAGECSTEVKLEGSLESMVEAWKQSSFLNWIRLVYFAQNRYLRGASTCAEGKAS